MTTLWTEACLTFPALDALKAGYEVYVVVDAVGGTSVAAHEAALRRIEQAGGKPISVPLQWSNVSIPTIGRMIASEGPASGMPNNVAAVVSALESAGVEFIAENGSEAGVRLKKVRTE